MKSLKLINYKEKLLNRIKLVHLDCHKLCQKTFKKYFPVSGNVGVFCQSEDEYEQFMNTRKEITKPSNNPNQKYFQLLNPITIEKTNNIPETTYTHLYVRKPDSTPYGKYLGDVDFVLDPDDYSRLKDKVIKRKFGRAVKLYDRPGWDTVQITDPKINSVAYVSTMEMAKKARIKFD